MGTICSLFIIEFFINFENGNGKILFIFIYIFFSLIFIFIGYWKIDHNSIIGSSLIGSILFSLNLGIII